MELASGVRIDPALTLFSCASLMIFGFTGLGPGVMFAYA